MLARRTSREPFQSAAAWLGVIPLHAPGELANLQAEIIIDKISVELGSSPATSGFDVSKQVYTKGHTRLDETHVERMGSRRA